MIPENLKKLADLYGIQPEYNSAFGTKVEATSDGILRVLKAFGVNVKPDLSDVDKVYHREFSRHWSTPVEPVMVFWQGPKARFIARLPEAAKKKARADIAIRLEDGGQVRQSVRLAALPAKRKITIDGEQFVEFFVPVKGKFPLGYHQAVITIGGKKHSSLVISAPRKAYSATRKEAPARSTGIFAPTYAIHSRNSLGIGDFSNLSQLIDWAYVLGCDFVGTLPMLAIFTGKPMTEPSPYSPVSRVFWNEMYIDPRASDEWVGCRKARQLVSTSAFTKEATRLNATKLVDYDGAAKLKRKVLHALADYFFEQKLDGSKAFREFLRIQPRARDYAAFRATCEKQNKPWQKWPERMRNGKLQPGDYSNRDFHYHLYAQYLVHQQLSRLSRHSRVPGKRGVYLDFPLSAHASGYDVWREKQSFIHSAAAGAPPDPAHVKGQDWGILPLNPRGIREEGYRYFRACLSNHMRYAGLLRLDHVMCFYRLYWVPQGLSARDGVYVRYNLEEFFALLALESCRNRCTLIGEDLGTVPPEIRKAMTRHKILRMYCQQRRLKNDPKEPYTDVPPNCICSLNTHDMPPFAAFWYDHDLVDKMKLGYFDKKQLPGKKADRLKIKKALETYLRKERMIGRNADLNSILRALLIHTARGPAQVMQVNIEDLWLETQPQNTPGTWKERPNWRHRLRYAIEELPKLKELPALFEEILKERSKAR